MQACIWWILIVLLFLGWGMTEIKNFHSLDIRKNAASRLEQEGWSSGKVGRGVTITPFLPHSLEKGASKANAPVYNSPMECDILLIIYLSNWGQVQVCMIEIILIFIFMSVDFNLKLLSKMLMRFSVEHPGEGVTSLKGGGTPLPFLFGIASALQCYPFPSFLKESCNVPSI